MKKTDGKIAIFVISRFSLSGAEKRFIRIASELCKYRKDIILILNIELYKLALDDVELSVKIQWLKTNNCLIVLKNRFRNRYFRIFSDFVNLYTIIKRKKINTLHCSLGALKYSRIKKIINVKVIAEITSPDVADNISQDYKKEVQLFDRLIAVSEGVKSRTIESLKDIKKERLIKEIHLSKIPFYLPKLGANNFDSTEKENLIVYASRFIERKNPILFSKSILKVVEEYSDWKVVILGRGPLEEDIEYILKDYIDNKRVKVTHTKDMYSYLKRSKIFVSLIYPDNYPSQSILEAMYMKNAIVATDVGNTNKLVTEKNGFLIENYNVDSVYKKIKEAIAKQDLLMEKGIQSSKIIEDRFSKDIYLEDLQAVYDSL